jgi:Holliday junction resolvase RusA-like endonuclease
MGAKCPVCKLGRGQVRVFPSKQFRAYQEGVANYVRTKPQLQLAVSAPVALAAVFYRDRASGDLMGYVQGLCDLLQHCGIILNDRQVASLDGTRLDKDAGNPRVEISLTVLKADVQEEIGL